ncbi:phosphatidic acid phosphatase type 2/haloperoxidase [Gautieria morchelliformis]|nr:phosphatidic acid phosphatase type 2/haloperoxidase [Gautieria morchelliformis]
MRDLFADARRLPNFHTAYLTDWAVAWLLVGLGSWVKIMPVFERDFMVDDPLIHHRHTKQSVNGMLLTSLAVYIPLLIILVVGGSKRSWIGMHHGSLSLFLAIASQRLIVNALKNGVGRLRPDFMARCKWDPSLAACTGHPDAIRDGRRSFPSGHSSLAFTGLTFLSIYLVACMCPSQATSASSRLPNFLKSKAVSVFITLAPLGVATWIAITRLEDYRHHKEDVITGAGIGSLCAYVTYNIYWEPFHDGYRPRRVYTTGTLDPNSDYELAQLDDPSNNV